MQKTTNPGRETKGGSFDGVSHNNGVLGVSLGDIDDWSDSDSDSVSPL